MSGFFRKDRKMKRQKQVNLSLVCMTIIPIIVLGIVISIYSYYHVRTEIYREVEVELTDLATVAAGAFGQIYPGDYHLSEENGEDVLYKGEIAISRYCRYIEQFKDDTETEISIFYGDTRYITTLKSAQGKTARTFINNEVLKEGKTEFYPGVLIDGQQYFAVYLPLKNLDGTIVGMMGIAKEAGQVNQSVKNVVLPIIVITAIVIFCTSLMMILYFQRTEHVVRNIKQFLENIANGKLDVQLHTSITERNDEFGDIGKAAVQMKYSLRKLLENDMLTDLYNRAYGAKCLIEVIDALRRQEESYSVALGDIDYFKKVNDTYGHEVGDEVLRRVSYLLKQGMAGKGYAIRWGGEEFLLIFKRKNANEAKIFVEEILENIRKERIIAGEKEIKVTMTRGLVTGDKEEDNSQVVSRADTYLYKGKQNGRNCIVTE